MTNTQNPVRRKDDLLAAGRAQRSRLAFEQHALVQELQPRRLKKRIFARSTQLVASRLFQSGRAGSLLTLAGALTPLLSAFGKRTKPVFFRAVTVLGAGLAIYQFSRWTQGGCQREAVPLDKRTK
jgi:hypothetical protein